jgi:hypothetical protein
VEIGTAIGGLPRIHTKHRRTFLKSLPDSPLISSLSEGELDRFARVSAAPTTLGELAEITRGMECGKNDPHVTSVPGDGLYPVISGEGVGEFVLRDQGLYMPRNLQPEAKYKSSLFVDAPRILLRFVAPYPIAALDTRNTLNFNTVYNITLRKGGLEEHAALACLLNSSIVRWWFAKAFNSEEGIFPHIQKYQLGQIPLPTIDLSSRTVRLLVKLGFDASSGKQINRIELDRICLSTYTSYAQAGSFSPASNQRYAVQQVVSKERRQSVGL